MLHAPLLFLLGIALQVPPKIDGTLRSQADAVPPVFVFEGSANLPNNAIVEAYLYHGAPHFGTELLRGRSVVRDGKFQQEFPVFTKRNFPGRYSVRILFDPELQNLATPGFVAAQKEFAAVFGSDEDFVRESKGVRDQLGGEIRALAALGEEVRAKLKELEGKTDPAVWEPLISGWRGRMNDIERRTNPRQIPEYGVLHLNSIADSGIEHLGAILMAAAQCAYRGQTGPCIEGLTRLQQTAEGYVAEIAAPKLVEPRQIADLLQEMRTLCREAAAKPGQPTLAPRRRYVEMNQVLQRSFPEDAQTSILELGGRGPEFFAAVADSKPEAREQLAAIERILDRLVAALSKTK